MQDSNDQTDRKVRDAKERLHPPTPGSVAGLIQGLSEKIDASGANYEAAKVIDLGLHKAKNLGEAIRLSVGAASVCWENMAGIGEFRSDLALAIAVQLQDEVQRQFGELTYSLVEMQGSMTQEEFLEEWLKLMRGPQSDRIIELAVSDEPAEYPREAGEITVLGPEVFIAKDGSVISYRGENFYPQAEIDRRVNQHKANIARSATAELQERKITENLDGEFYD